MGREYKASAARLRAAKAEYQRIHHEELEAAKRAQTAARVRKHRAKKAAEAAARKAQRAAEKAGRQGDQQNRKGLESTN